VDVLFLGTGTSHGVPMIGCRCAVCRSDDPRDTRMRPSVLVRLSGATRPRTRGEGPEGAGPVSPGPARTFPAHILIDTATDLRSQALRFGVDRVDAVLFTHGHADHVFGLDDTRRFTAMSGAPLPLFADEATLDDLGRIFSYALSPEPREGGGVPALTLFRIGGPFSLFGQEIVPVPIFHGRRPILGFRIGRFAYLTDCSAIPDASWPLLSDLDVLVIDALRDRPHPTHFTVSEAVTAAQRIGAGRTYLTHLCHDLGHAALLARLPAGIEPAHDGLRVDVRS
jgi:phosphoribosyl 1,2-cyclic phosphate phosphodiesterase